MANKLIRPAKQALAKKFGYKNVSVTNGHGTAWGWVHAKVPFIKPIDCYCATTTTFTGVCQVCSKAMNDQRLEAERIMLQAWEKMDMTPYTYTADDGYDSQHNDVIVEFI